MSVLDSLRALRDTLPRCERFPRCGKLATREYRNAPGYTKACDNPEHVPDDPTNHPVRDLPWGAALREALTW